MGKTFWTRGMDTSSVESESNAADPEQQKPEVVEMTKSVEAGVKHEDEEKKAPEKNSEGVAEPEPPSQDTEEYPTWKRCLYWFLGYNPKDNHEVPQEASMIKSIEENPIWQKFTLINALILTGVSLGMMVWWW